VRRSARLAVALAVTLLGCCGMIERLVYFPDRSMTEPPAGVAERWLTAADGTRIHAWQALHANPAAAIVWSHGNAGNVSSRADVVSALAARGFEVLAYDYRGYGKSDGRPSEAGLHLDAEAAFDAEIARGVPASNIVCFGESLGGAVSIHLATRRPCAAVVVVATFTTLRDVARFHYGPLGHFAGGAFDSLSLAPSLSVPLFAAHGDRDEVVPYALGERLFDAVPSPKRFLRLEGVHHNDVFDSTVLLDGIAEFVNEHVPPRPPVAPARDARPRNDELT
jgi:fermentation-respiration switch protein FrsA (DUF1100 family)